MKIIVTGATGFVGRNLVAHLHGEGQEVVATGRNAAVGTVLERQGIDFRPADVTRPGDLARVFSRADCVVHCAGRPGDWGTYQEFHRTNVLGTQNVASACLQHEIGRLLYLSTPSIYFTGRDRFDITEAEPLPRRQATPYGRTKLEAETELRRLQGRDLQVIIFRPRAVYGPHDGTILPRILRMAAKRRFPLVGGGNALVDITYVGNLADAVTLALHAPESAWNEAYNISNGSPIRIRDWFARVLELCERPFHPVSIPETAARAAGLLLEVASRLPLGPKEPSMTRYSVGYMARSMTLSIDKARRRLGYASRYNNEEGFARTAAWWRSECPSV